MSEQTVVECPLCGEGFDPTAAGGWCTNSECGEWQYEGDLGDGGDPVAGGRETAVDDADATPETDDGWLEPIDEEPDDGATTPDGVTDDAVSGESADPAEPGHPDAGTSGPSTTEARSETTSPDDAEADTGDAALADTGDAAEADTEDAAEADTGDAALADTEDAATGGAGVADPTAGADSDPAEDTLDCSDCGATLPADADFCTECGSELTVESGTDGLGTCPTCDAAVDPEANFCSSCGEDLEAHRGGTELDSCPSCDAEVDPEDSFCPSCGEDLDAHRGGGTDGTASGHSAGTERAAGGETSGTDTGPADTDETPSALALTAGDRSVVVADGDTVGRELRSLAADLGRSEDEAVRIHREHVRFVREDGQFFLVDLGTNPTELDGRQLRKGDREPVSPGDELTLSGVLTVTVEVA